MYAIVPFPVVTQRDVYIASTIGEAGQKSYKKRRKYDRMAID
jgi:hypothetical protein